MTPGRLSERSPIQLAIDAPDAPGPSGLGCFGGAAAADRAFVRLRPADDETSSSIEHDVTPEGSSSVSHLTFDPDDIGDLTAAIDEAIAADGGEDVAVYGCLDALTGLVQHGDFETIDRVLGHFAGAFREEDGGHVHFVPASVSPASRAELIAILEAHDIVFEPSSMITFPTGDGRTRNGRRGD